VICGITEGTNFPHISIPLSTNMMHDWIAGKKYTSTIWPAKIQLATYPEKKIQSVLSTDIKPGFHLLFDWETMPGESGTVASVEGEKEDVYLVVVRTQTIRKDVVDMYTPAERKLFRWHEGKIYGVGTLVHVNVGKNQ